MSFDEHDVTILITLGSPPVVNRPAPASQWKIDVPAEPRIAKTLEAQLRYILINMDGPSIQPGSRSYERSWIRDGSLTSDGVAAPRTARRGAGLPRVLRESRVARGLRAVLREHQRRARSGAGARQPRPVHLPRGRVLPPHARSGLGGVDVAGRAARRAATSTNCATSG